LQEVEANQSSVPDDPLPELFTADEWNRLATELRLSPRQAQVARLICLGLSKEEMATRLRVSEPTARLHVKELFRKLRVNDRVGVPVRLVVAGRVLGVPAKARNETA
jgi:DNA-binding NarL/FixJ family response regulator